MLTMDVHYYTEQVYLTDFRNLPFTVAFIITFLKHLIHVLRQSEDHILIFKVRHLCQISESHPTHTENQILGTR